MMKPSTLSRDISPPRARSAASARLHQDADNKTRTLKEESGSVLNAPQADARPTLAAVEAGEAQIYDHLDYFVTHLRATLRTTSSPALDIDAFEALYRRNQHKHGRHFVVHQHDHPISGISDVVTLHANVD